MRVYTGSLIILKDLQALYSFSEVKHPFIVIYNIIIISVIIYFVFKVCYTTAVFMILY